MDDANRRREERVLVQELASFLAESIGERVNLLHVFYVGLGRKREGFRELLVLAQERQHLRRDVRVGERKLMRETLRERRLDVRLRPARIDVGNDRIEYAVQRELRINEIDNLLRAVERGLDPLLHDRQFARRRAVGGAARK